MVVLPVVQVRVDLQQHFQFVPERSQYEYLDYRAARTGAQGQPLARKGAFAYEPKNPSSSWSERPLPRMRS